MSAYKIFNKLYKKKSIKEFYESKIKIKPSTGIDGVNEQSFNKNLEMYLDTIHRKVNNNTYNFIPYKEKLISKGKEKFPRVISIPSIRDKLSLAILHKLLSEVFKKEVNLEIVQTVVSNIKKSMNNSNYNFFIKIDIEKFYDNISHEILLKKLNKKIKKKEIVNLITKAIETPTINTNTRKPYGKNIKGVPQGLSISNILANIYMNQLDQEYSKSNQLEYFRYVDDILIICSEKDKDLIEENLISQIHQLDLHINTMKNEYGLLVGRFNFLGYEFKNKRVGVRKENIHRLEQSLIEVFTRYKYSGFSKKSEFVWSLNLKITGGIIDGKKYGWVFFYSQIDSIEILYHLDKFIEKQFKRFNINDISPQAIKSFLKTYHEIIYNRSSSKYIPNFDEYTISQKRDFLNNIVNIKNVKGLRDELIDMKFRRYVFKTIKKLEKDIQHIS